MTKKSTIIKTLAMLVLLCVALVSVISCGPKKKPDTTPGSNNGGTDENLPADTEGLIYNGDTTLKLVMTDYQYCSIYCDDLINTLMDSIDGDRFVTRYDDDGDVFDHEIVIGKSEREVSQKAYSYLERLMEGKSSEFGGYVLYSDGSSLALAYTKELGDQHLNEIMNYLIDCAKHTSLVLEKGIISSKTYDMYEIYSVEDKARQDEAFELLAEMTSKEVADNVRTFYDTLYRRDDNVDIISWLANLYEPRKCICENYDENGIRVCLHPTGPDGRDLCANGGFYYSNLARNTEGFLPDIESTNQALEFLEKTGMLSSFGGKYENVIKGQLRADIVAFTKGLQDSSGYFYHPQWTKEATNAHWERVSRDLMWSVSILSSFDELPYYATPAGELPGTGGRPITTTPLTSKLGVGAVSAVSKVLPAASNLPAHLQSAAAFKAHLDTKDLTKYGTGYAVANALAAEVNQIVAANDKDPEIKTVFSNWAEATHRPDNGLWSDTGYDALNACFKILMVYSALGLEFPYAEEALNSAIEVLSSTDDPGHVCGTYNTWYDIAGLLRHIRAYESSAKADELQAHIIEIAPDAIKQTIVNTSAFKCDDGSFSYFAASTSDTSQGMPVAPGKNKEGDINASLICSGGIVEYIGQALGLSSLGIEMPPIFGTSELAKFLDIIDENGFSLKDQLPPDIIVNFEDDNVGNNPAGVGVSQSSGGTTLVELDPKNEENQVLNFKSVAKSGTWDSVNVKNNTAKGTNNCLVFEGKFMFAREGTSDGYLIQFYIGGQMGKPTAYFINFTTTTEGIQVWECSADSNENSFSRLIGTFAYDEWFKLRVEYYVGKDDEATGSTAHDSVRIKVYTNDAEGLAADKEDKLVAVSSNYMDNSMKKFLDGVGTPSTGEGYGATFFVMSYLSCNIYLDDIYLGYKKIEYKNEKDTEGLIINEDADAERKTYTFDEAAKPEDIGVSGSNVTFPGNTLNLAKDSSVSKLTIPALNRAHYANVFSLGFDINISEAAAGDTFVINFKDPYKNANIVSYTMRCVEIDNKMYLVPVYKGTTLLNSAAIPVDGTTHSLDFAFFVDQATTLIYKDGEMIASTEQGVIGKCYFYEMSRVEIEYKGNISAAIDNLYCERRLGDFAEETKPKYDRIVYDFANGLGGATSNGALVDGMLNLAGGKYITIPANDRSAYVSAYQLHAYIDTTKYSGDEKMFVRFLDKDNNTIVGFVLEVKGDVMYMYDMVGNNLVGKYVATGEFDGKAFLDVNMFQNEKAFEVRLDEKLVLVSSIFNGGEYGSVAKVEITAQKAFVDDLYLDGITLTYTAPKVTNQPTPDSTSELITYDYSTLGNVPERLNVPSGVTQTSTIDYVLRDGELNKMLIYKKTLTNYPSGLRYSFRDKGLKNEFVFETDIKVDADTYDIVGSSPSGRSNFDILFANQSGGTQMFTAQFWIFKNNTTQKYHLYVNMSSGRASTDRIDLGVIADDGWMNLKFEVKGGDGTNHEKSGAKLVIYFNGEEKYTTQHYMDLTTIDGKADITSAYQAMIIPATMFTGTVYIDNTTLEPATK